MTAITLEAGRLDVAGVSTALLDTGPSGLPGAPPVLLLHGSGPGVTAAANWRTVIPALSADRRVIAPDQLGFGGTATGEPRTYAPRPLRCSTCCPTPGCTCSPAAGTGP